MSAQPPEPEVLCLGAVLAALGSGGATLGLNHTALGSEVFGLWVEQLASAPNDLGGFRCGCPSGVSCMGPVR